MGWRTAPKYFKGYEFLKEQAHGSGTVMPFIRHSQDTSVLLGHQGVPLPNGL